MINIYPFKKDEILEELHDITILDLILNRIEDLLVAANIDDSLDEIEYKISIGDETLHIQHIALFIIYEDYKSEAMNYDIHPSLDSQNIKNTVHHLDMEIHKFVMRYAIPQLQERRYKQLIKNRRILSRFFTTIPKRFSIKTKKEADKILDVINIIEEIYKIKNLRESSTIIKQDNSHGKSKKKYNLTTKDLKNKIKLICEKNLQYTNKQKKIYITNAIIKTITNNTRRYL